MRHFDYLVIGIGSMGSATCYYLASRGCSVLGIDQFDVPHEQGAHGGQSRIFRKSYFEHSDYVPLLQRAYDNWSEIERVSKRKIYFETGLLYAAPKGHELLKGVKKSASLYNIPLLNELKINHPQFSFPENYEFLFEPEAGFLLSDVAIKSYLDTAVKAGAHIFQNEKLLHWEVSNDIVIVKTDKESYSCKKIIFTAGPWSAKLLPEFQSKLTISRQILIWLKPTHPESFNIQNFPCWLSASDDKMGGYYGFPIIPKEINNGPDGIKIALHLPGNPTDPDKVDRSIYQSDTELALQFINRHLPHAGVEITDVKTCLYSMTPDEHFVIDFVPDTHHKASMAWGFSGHGFKFVSVMGEILADLAMYEKTSLPIDFLRVNRF